MDKKLAWFISIALVMDLALLALFGKSYTTLLLIKPFFYAHDLVLLTIGILSIPYFRFKQRIKSVELFFGISCVYLIYSCLKLSLEDSYYILRQFMLFGYGILIYFILNRLTSLDNTYKNFVKYLIYFGVFCFIVQVLNITYAIVLKSNVPILHKYYYSPIIMLGLVLMGSYVLINIKNTYLKHILFLLVFFTSLTTGHDSLYLSLGLVYFSYLFLKVNRSQRVILTLCLLTAGVCVFAFVPTFTDVNMEWRFLFWKDSLAKVIDNYVILGDGFGIQYASDETVSQLNDLFSWPINGPQIVGDGKYLCAPHNSFISMLLHIGILSIILLIYPLKTLFSNKRLQMDNEILFLFLSLLGIVIFCSFNVILELPHSSSLFWIVYFVLVFKLNDNKNQNEL